MTSKRVKWLDFAKGFTIFLVVLYHALITSANNQIEIELYKFLTIFMMPMFFTISGYLYKPINTIHKYILMIYKKFTSLVIPGMFFVFIGLMFQNPTKLVFFLKNFYKFFICQYGDIWFLNILFVYFVISGLMDLLHIPLLVKFIISLILLSLSNIKFPIQSIIIRWGARIYAHGGNSDTIKDIELYFVYFCLGYIIKRYHIAYYLKYKFINVILPLLTLVLIALIHLKFPGLKMGIHPIICMIIRVISIIALISIFVSYKQNNYSFQYFRKVGNYTLVVYLVHWPLIYFLIPKVIGNIYNSYFIVIIKFIIAWIISIIIWYITKRVKIIDFIFYPRKYINKLLVKTKWGQNFLK